MLDVAHVMTSPVITIPPHMALPKIKLTMKEHGVHRLPVVGGAGLLGIVTLGDVRNAFPSDAVHDHDAGLHRRIEQIQAKQIMRTDVVTIAANVPLREALRLMLLHRISGLPVIDQGRLVGMITKSDVCRAVLAGTLQPAPASLVDGVGV